MTLTLNFSSALFDYLHFIYSFGFFFCFFRDTRGIYSFVTSMIPNKNAYLKVWILVYAGVFCEIPGLKVCSFRKIAL